MTFNNYLLSTGFIKIWANFPLGKKLFGNLKSNVNQTFSPFEEGIVSLIYSLFTSKNAVHHAHFIVFH